MLPPLVLAQSIDPTAIGDKLGQAQSVQQVLGVIIGVLLLTLIALVTFYLRERKAWNEEKVKLVEDHNAEQKDLIGRWSQAKVDWEQERTRHTEALLTLRDTGAKEKEGMFREMMDIVLRVEQALANLVKLKRGE